MTYADDLINILRSATKEQKKLLAIELTKIMSCYGPRISYTSENMTVYNADGTVAFTHDMREPR